MARRGEAGEVGEGKERGRTRRRGLQEVGSEEGKPWHGRNGENIARYSKEEKSRVCCRKLGKKEGNPDIEEMGRALQGRVRKG